MAKKQTEGWAIRVTRRFDGGVWWKYNTYGQPWKRRADAVKRIVNNNVQHCELFHISYFYEPVDE